MSESRLHYTVYFESRAQAAAWAAEAEATAQLSSPEQARVLERVMNFPLQPAPVRQRAT